MSKEEDCSKNWENSFCNPQNIGNIKYLLTRTLTWKKYEQDWKVLPPLPYLVRTGWMILWGSGSVKALRASLFLRISEATSNGCRSIVSGERLKTFPESKLWQYFGRLVKFNQHLGIVTSIVNFAWTCAQRPFLDRLPLFFTNANRQWDFLDSYCNTPSIFH